MADFDLIVLGSGPGGYVAAIRAAQLGMQVAIVEKENLGGVCLNWGCIPTKALLQSAQLYQKLAQADNYGISIQNIQIDASKIFERSREIAQTMSQGVSYLMRKNKITVIQAYGKLLPGKRLETTLPSGEIKEYRAKHIIIATGGRSKNISSLPQDDEVIFDYKKALHLNHIPDSLVIVGAGAIGCEFAYLYQSLGTQVTLIEYYNRILPLEDKEISKGLEKSLQKLGVKVMSTSRVLNSSIKNSQADLLISTPQGEIHVKSDFVLSAVGMQANIENIGLEFTGIQIDSGKIKTNEFYQTNVEGYYAIGDVTHGPALAHVASAEAIICVEKIAGLSPIPLRSHNIPSCIYTQPEVASVGLTEREALEQGYELAIGRFPFTASGKAQASGHTEGFVKVIFDKKYGELLGAHLLGTHVTEMISELVLAKEMEATAESILHTVHPHPTMSEAILEAVADAYKRCIHL